MNDTKRYLLAIALLSCGDDSGPYDALRDVGQDCQLQEHCLCDLYCYQALGNSVKRCHEDPPK